MYSREDVLDFMDFLQGSIKSHIQHDMAKSINMGALAVSQLLTSAQEKGVDLVLETANIENSTLLDSVNLY